MGKEADHNQPLSPIVQAPASGNVFDASGVRFRGPEIAGDDWGEGFAGEEFGQEVGYGTAFHHTHAVSSSSFLHFNRAPGPRPPLSLAAWHHHASEILPCSFFFPKGREDRVHSLEVPGTDPLLDSAALEILHQGQEARLGLLGEHGGGFDGADGGEGARLLGGG